jgi:hypothetical protein
MDWKSVALQVRLLRTYVKVPLVYQLAGAITSDPFGDFGMSLGLMRKEILLHQPRVSVGHTPDKKCNR